MLVTILISLAVVLVIFAVANKKAKQPVTLDDNGSKPKETPVVGPLEEEDGWNWKEEVGYETSSLDAVIEREEPATSVVPVIVKEQPKPKAKKKMSAKPKAPKKKKDA